MCIEIEFFDGVYYEVLCYNGAVVWKTIYETPKVRKEIRILYKRLNKKNILLQEIREYIYEFFNILPF